ncbi:hypothetical protein NHX12_030623 [Muraenolepis orangiensis]|uniref:Uncharacterized protein n=1 Tax=Muraenolepis orangiensis TaxID=630683 RepID=A0A9Q0IM09_9TELE|nr:hypothetical protein NHX12_030623 [Muraenolepis orangiensis]
MRRDRGEERKCGEYRGEREVRGGERGEEKRREEREKELGGDERGERRHLSSFTTATSSTRVQESVGHGCVARSEGQSSGQSSAAIGSLMDGSVRKGPNSSRWDDGVDQC